MASSAAVPGNVADFGKYKLEEHVGEALKQAWVLRASIREDVDRTDDPWGKPLRAADLLRGALRVRDANSPAFRQLASLLPSSSHPEIEGLEVPLQKFSPWRVTDAVMRSFIVAEPFFKAKGIIWGRDSITFALLAKDDPSLDQLAKEASTTPGLLRDSWYEFVTSRSKHRTPEEWQKWWADAEVPLPRQSFLFTWNPDQSSFSDFDRKLAEIETQGWAIRSWGLGNRLSIPKGARAFLFRQGDDPRGVVGVGEVHAEVQRNAEGPASVEVKWTALSREPLLTLAQVVEETKESEIWKARASGVQLPWEVAQKLEKLWLRMSAAQEFQSVAGYVSDSVPEGELGDELGIRDDVNTLCSVLLAKDVNPPLAVGLFGDWGTGKSYFMEAMHGRIRKVAELSAGAESAAYYSNVVQIRFNAWHYLDANLWASLVTHIFDELSRKLCPQESPEDTKKRLTKELASAKQVRDQAEAEKQAAEKEKIAATTALDIAVNERKAKEVKLAEMRPSDLIQLLTPDEQQQLKTELSSVLKDLGVPPLLNSFSDMQDAVRQAVSLAGRTHAVLRSFSSSPRSTVLLVLVAFGLIAAPVATWVIAHWTKEASLASINMTLGEITAAVTAVALALKKHITKASNLLTQVETKRDEALNLIRARQNEKSKEEQQLESELETLRGKEEIALRQLEQAESRIREIQRKIDEIDAGQNLSRFILERVQADDYRKHLGIISTIRRDFERLGDLLKNGQAGLDKVGRIILYIDDLDRCPTTKVVEVLQAVHLLLAMPLFVVVVGVDLRWLLHSLEEEYTAFHSAERNGDASIQQEWITSPQNYLEKIFQIPFNLNPMQDKGYKKLVKILLPETIHESDHKVFPRPTPTPDGPGADRMPSIDFDTAVQPAEKEELKAQPEKSQPDPNKEIELNPASLRIQAWEREFAESLFAFMPSPRAAKRFANVYRLLKAPLSARGLQKFEGSKEQPGEFQAAMLLLATATGIPQDADKLFRALLSPPTARGTWSQLFAANLALSPAQSAVLAKVVLKGDLKPFQDWVPKVARFTFEAAKSAIAVRNQIAQAAAKGEAGA